MAEIYESVPDVNKKSKLKNFYESNKILIFSFITIMLILIFFFLFYFEKKEEKKVLLSENFIQAKIYLGSKNNEKAINILKSIIDSNDYTYSTLSLFLIVNQNLIKNKNEVAELFSQVLENNKLNKELRNLLIFKKAVYESSYVTESEILKSTEFLISKDNETLWRPHALLLLGDYFVSKNEYLKAKEFYLQILLIKNLHANLYEKAKSQLIIIENK